MMFFKTWTYMCGDGRGALAFSLNFSKMIFHQRLSFSLAVRISATSSPGSSRFSIWRLPGRRRYSPEPPPYWKARRPLDKVADIRWTHFERSLVRNYRSVSWLLVSMVGRYDVISKMFSPFWWKSTKCWRKAAKRLTVSYSTCVASKNLILKTFQCL